MVKSKVNKVAPKKRVPYKYSQFLDDDGVPVKGKVKYPECGVGLQSKSMRKHLRVVHQTINLRKKGVSTSQNISNQIQIGDQIVEVEFVHSIPVVENNLADANSKLEQINSDLNDSNLKLEQAESVIKSLREENSQLKVELEKIVKIKNSQESLIKRLRSRQAIPISNSVSDQNVKVKVYSETSVQMLGEETVFFDNYTFTSQKCDDVVTNLSKSAAFLKQEKVRADGGVVGKDVVKLICSPGNYFNRAEGGKHLVVFDANNILADTGKKERSKPLPNIQNLFRMIRFFKGHPILLVLDKSYFTSFALNNEWNEVISFIKDPENGATKLFADGKDDDPTVIINSYCHLGFIVSNDLFLEFFRGSEQIRTFLMERCFGFSINTDSIELHKYGKKETSVTLKDPVFNVNFSKDTYYLKEFHYLKSRQVKD